MTTIRPIALSDFQSWNRLYAAYAEFYQVEQTQEMRDITWAWLHDVTQETKGLLAVSDAGEAIGLAHYRAFARPLSATRGGFLDDLFVAPQARGGDVGTRLIKALSELGRQQNWSVIRWITADNNYRARSSYDKLATRTTWITYDIKL